MYILANLGIQGGSGAPTASVVFPQTMQIDYIRAFARVNDGKDDTLPPTAATPTSGGSSSSPGQTSPPPSTGGGASAPSTGGSKPSTGSSGSGSTAPAPAPAPAAGTATLAIAASSGSMSVGGSFTVKGTAGTKFVNVAAFDTSNGWAKVSSDVKPDANGAFTLVLKGSSLKKGSHKIQIMAFTVAAGQPGGTSKNAAFTLTVTRSRSK
jgi:hypothetical protein